MNEEEKQLRRELEAAQAKLEWRKEENKRIAALPDDKRLAEYLHHMFCKSDHMSMCGWEHEKGEHEWTDPAHKRYLNKAQVLMKSRVPVHDIAFVLEIAKMERII